MDYMFSKLSHEIRNPLTSLHSSIQLIESQHPEVRDFKYWTSLNGDVKYIQSLLDDFSNYSKSDAFHNPDKVIRKKSHQMNTGSH